MASVQQGSTFTLIGLITMIEDGCIAADVIEHTMRTASVARYYMCNQFAKSLQQSKIIPVDS